MDKREFVKGSFDAIARRYDLTNRLLSFGIDALWRREAVKALGQQELVLDLCAGTLTLSSLYLRQFEAKVVALDFSLRMLEEGIKRRHSDGLLPLCGDALRLPFAEGTFSGAMVAFGLRNLTDPFEGLRELYRVLRPKGKLVVLEFGRPEIPVFRGLYHFYLSRVLPLLGGLITRRRDVYQYLFRSIMAFPSKQEMLQGMQRIGFQGLRFQDLTGGICVLYEGEKP